MYNSNWIRTKRLSVARYWHENIDQLFAKCHNKPNKKNRNKIHDYLHRQTYAINT